MSSGYKLWSADLPHVIVNKSVFFCNTTILICLHMIFGGFHVQIAELDVVTGRYGLQSLKCVLFCLLRKFAILWMEK